MDILFRKNINKGAVCVFLSLFLFVLPQVSLGQPYHFKNFNVEDGLAQSQVRSIFQDSRGYVWIGTLGGGVSKYNGLEFINFNKKDGLSDNNILSINEDRTGHLWFGTHRGACRYDGKNFVCITTEDGLVHNNIMAILEDHEGNIWFCTEGGISLYDGFTFTNFTEKDGLINNAVNEIIEDHEGSLWFGTEGGVCKYDGKNFTQLAGKDGLSENSVGSILEDREGNLWFGTDNGVYKYDGKNFTHLTERDGLSDNTVGSILEDHEGNLWFGTEGGISLYDGFTFTNFIERDGLSSNSVWSMIEDREGNLWIGTYRGGIDKYKKSPFTQFTTKDGLTDNIVRSIVEDKKGNIWFGTYRGGVSGFDGKVFTSLSATDGLVDNFVLTILEDRAGNLWFGTYRGVSKYDGRSFINFTEKDGLCGNLVRSIIEDKIGNIWFGTDSGGICKFDGVSFTNFSTKDGLNDDEIMTIFEDQIGNIWIGSSRGINIFNGENFVDFTEKHGLPKEESVFTIIEDQKGYIWFGVYGEGIVRYTPAHMTPEKLGEKDGSDGSFLEFSSKDGLYDDTVISMSLDKDANLWIGTEKGISRLNIKLFDETGRIEFENYGREEGFTGLECIHNSVCRDSKGNMWFGTLRGAIRYNPKDDRPNQVEPLTHITNLRLFFEDVDWSTYTDKLDNNGLPVGLKLPYNQNHIIFDFMGISLSIPNKVRYQYKLEGFDMNWSPVQKETYSIYSNLPPGKYIFNVKACNENGVWNTEPANFNFEMTPPFWQKWWFYVSIFLVIAGSIRAYIKIRMRRLQKINLELEKLTLVASKTDNAVMIAEGNGRIEWINEGFTTMTGYVLEELRESKRDTLMEISSIPIMPDITDEDIVQKKSKIYESLIESKDGKKLWTSLTLTPIFDRNGELKKIVVIGTNITERKQVEEALKESEERYRELVEKAGIGILIDDEEGNIVYANKKAAELHGYSLEEMKEQSFKSLVHPDEIERVTKYHKDRIQGRKVPSSYEFRAIRKDGGIFHLEVDAAPNKKGEKIIGTRTFLKDITERKKAEEEGARLQARLMQSEKMAGLGTLTSGIAHEFNNLLQIMSGNVQLAQRTKRPEDMAEALDIVADISDRTTKIIRDLLAFSRQETPGKEPCDVTGVIESVLSLTEGQLRKNNIEVVRSYEETSELRVNKGELQQVFLNMVTNARDAMVSSGGILKIDVRERDGNVDVRFRDTGEGIEERDLGRVFEPFYTTKGAVGGSTAVSGTGLGLSVSYGIVKRHGGDIEVESRKGEGTIFTVILPVGDKEPIKESRQAKDG